MKKIIAVLIMMLFIIPAIPSAGITKTPINSYIKDNMTFQFTFNEPHITENDEYHSIKIDGLQNYNNPGDPVIPIKPVKILIPYCKSIKDISITGDKHVLGHYKIEPGQTPLPTTDINNDPEYHSEPIPTLPNDEVYASNFPNKLYDTNTQSCMGYQILILTLYPVHVNAGKVSYYSEMNINIKLQSKRTQNYQNYQNDNRIQDLGVLNLAALQSYPKAKRDTPMYDYIIITTSEFADEFQVLADWKATRASTTPYINLNTTVVLLEDIISDTSYWVNGTWGDNNPDNPFYQTEITENYTLFNDTQCHIRNFIRMANYNWSTEYVLLGGDADEPIIPHRGMYSKVGSIIDYNIPCDMYYGCLDGNWNTDHDDMFGEVNFYGVDESDILAEVFIGRAPVDSIGEANNFTRKTIVYEQISFTDNDYLSKALMIGGNLNHETEEANTIDILKGIVPQFTISKVSARDGTQNITKRDDGYWFSPSKNYVIDNINQGVHIVNYGGHAHRDNLYHTKRWSFHLDDISQLTNEHYFFVYSSGCNSGAFDNGHTKYPPTQYDVFGEDIVTSYNGAFAFIGYSRYAWFYSHTIDGACDRATISFYNVLSTESTNLGKTLQISKERELLDGSLSHNSMNRWSYYALNLLGDPEVNIKTRFNTPTAQINLYDPSKTYLINPVICHDVLDINVTARRGDLPYSTFDSYVVEIGQGVTPSEWTPITNENIESNSGTIITWDTTQIDDGLYTIRLIVYDMNGNQSSDEFIINVKNTLNIYNENMNEYYFSIQNAIDNANINDTISVGQGTFYERICIKKPITLTGNNTILDNFGRISTVISVYIGDYCNIDNFITLNGYYGIKLIFSKHGYIKNNAVMCYNGIRIRGCAWDHSYSGNTISNNTVQSQLFGIEVTGSDNNIVCGNNVISDVCSLSLVNVENTSVFGNILTGSSQGLFLAGYTISKSVNNYIFKNSIEGGKVVLSGTSDVSIKNNTIYNNNFLLEQITECGIISNNQWDNGYPTGGNYWIIHTELHDEYHGHDQNIPGSDGIADMGQPDGGLNPYIINNNNTDQYPFIDERVNVVVYAETLDENSHEQISCITGEQVLFTGFVNGGVLPYTYHWDFGDDITSDKQTTSHVYNQIGDYIVTLTVTDNNGIVANDTIMVNIFYIEYTITISTEPGYIIGEEVNIHGQLIDEEYTEIPMSPLCLSITDPDDNTQTIYLSTDNTGSYSYSFTPDILGFYTVHVSSSDFEVENTTMFEVIVGPLQADAGNEYYGIIGDPIEFHASAIGGIPPYTFTWDFDNNGIPDETGQTVWWEFDIIGEHTVNLTVTDIHENTAFDTEQVHISAPPLQANANGPYYGVVGEQIEFHGSATGGLKPYTWHWSNPINAYTQNTSYTFTEPFHFGLMFRVTDSEMNSDTDSFEVHINFPGDLNADNDVDHDDFLIFSSSFGRSVDDPSYNPNCDYDHDGQVSLLDYHIWYQYYCDYNMLSADAGESYHGYINEPVQFVGSASGGFAPYTFEWDIDDNGITDVTGQTIWHTFTVAGEYIINLTVTDIQSNTAFDTTIVTIIEPLSADAGNEYLGYYHQYVQFTGSANGGFGPYTFEWDFDEDSIPDAFGESVQWRFNDAGSYVVNLTVTDSQSNTASDTANVYITDERLYANAGDNYYGITNTPVQFTGSATGGFEPYSWEWDLNDDGITDSYDQNPAYSYDNEFYSWATLIVTDRSGETAVDYSSVQIKSEIIVDNNGPYTNIVDGEIQFEGDADGGFGWFTYQWDFGDGHVSNEKDTIHTYDFSGVYDVTLTATDDKGFSNSSTTTATIINSVDITYVDDDFDDLTEGWQINHFDNIQDATDITSAGGTVHVNPGTYDNIAINRPINILGQNRDTTIIEGGELTVDIRSDSVTFSGFTVRNNNDVGVYCCLANFIVITDNIIENNMYGIHLMTCLHSEISHNIIRNNFIGIILECYSNNNSIYNNVIEGDVNDYVGIGLSFYSDNNEVYHNNFLHDIDNEEYMQAYDDSINTWYNTTLQEGNYYDDYTGLDTNSDGIGDTSYTFLTGEDLYPLMCPFTKT